MSAKPRAHSQDPQVSPAACSQPDLAPPAPLPVPLGPLIGRELDVATAVETLRRDDVRLVTLTGPGGVGKSRLALATGAALQDEFAGGVHLVHLAAITDPEFVLPTMASALGLRESSGQPALEMLQIALYDRELLLLLDNFEQILAAATDLADLLRACPRLKALVTSRSRLRVRGEHVIPVMPLRVPDERAIPDVDAVLAYPAVQLFVQRGREIRPDLVQTPENAVAVAGICRQLDGLPLAIELAAARLNILPPTALLERLRQPLPVLVEGARDLPSRLRTMRDAIAWSYDLLDGDQQAIFRGLAVFAGGFTLEAAEAVIRDGAAPEERALAGITALVDASLLRLEEGGAAEPRFQMLETVREFGLEQLETSGSEEVAARQRHAAWCLELATRAAPEMFGPQQRLWCERLEREQPNLRAAFSWLMERGPAALALRMAGAIWAFWFLRGHLREGDAWLTQALAVTDDAPPADRAAGLFGAGMMAWTQGHFERAERIGSQARQIAAEHDLDFGIARALYLLFLAVDKQDRPDEAVALGEQAITRLRDCGAHEWLAYALADVGTLLVELGDRERGKAMIADGLAIHREQGNKQGLGNKLSDLGRLSLDAGDLQTAARHYSESLHWLLEGGDAWYFASAIEGLAALALGAGHGKQAARLLGGAAVLRERSGSTVWPEERERLARTVAAAQAALGEEGYAQMTAVGRTLPLAELVAEATAVGQTLLDPAHDEPAPSPVRAFGLSLREQEVLQLLAEGKSNPEIAEALFIGRGTVRTHVSNILGKLGAKTRTEAAALARERGLI